MPILDYEKRAEVSEKKFFERKEISQKNKDCLLGTVKEDGERTGGFLDIYNVSPARKVIFFNHIRHLLSRTKDIRTDMHNPDIINKIYKDLYTELSPSYYDTVVNVGKRLTTWLNGTVKPKGFKDVMGIPKKKRKRNIHKEDMITWEESLSISNKAKSVQMSTIPMVQIDGGFRPSEFIDITYGSCKRSGKFITVHVSEEHKTGARDVTLYKSVPYLLRWLDKHPTKKPNDPLWIMEYPQKSRKNKEGFQKFEYPTMLKRIRKIAEEVGIKKPMDFYNWRHSSCYLAKKENMPIDLAAEKFGHSTDFYVKVYGRLDEEDVVDRHKLHYKEGKKEEQNIDKPIECQVCTHINIPGAQICDRCQSALTLKKALEMKKESDDKMQEEVRKYVRELAREEINKKK